MLKLTSLAIGLLTAISIVPSAQAIPVIGHGSTNYHNNNLYPQVIVTVNPQYQARPAQYKYWSPAQRQRWEANRRRELELVREREARARWEAAHFRHQQYSKHHHGRNDYRRFQKNHDFR